MKASLVPSVVACGLVFWAKTSLAISCGDPYDSCYGNCDFQGAWCDCDSGCTSRGTCCEDYEECCLGCTPKCPSNYCGDDGCGGKCSCPYGPQWSCVGDQCVCTPYCQGAECGKDGCGGVCGQCPQGYVCAGGKCVLQTCTPNCFAQECGNGGCPDQPNACGVCSSGKTCNVNGQCVGCEPQCSGKQCGDDGCGGSCGSCDAGYECNAEGKCVCVPSCAGKECGSDGCGSTCGTCPSGSTCNEFGKCEVISVQKDILETQLPAENDDLVLDTSHENVEAGSDGHGYPEDSVEGDSGGQSDTDLPNTCPPGYTYSFGTCVPSPTSCPSGYVLSYGTCVPSPSPGSASGGCSSHIPTSRSPLSILLVLFAFSFALRFGLSGKSR